MTLKSGRTKHLSLACAAVAWALLASGAPSQEHGRPYEVYLWIDDAYGFDATAWTELAALGVTGIDAEGPAGVSRAVGAGLPFYVDHAVPKGFLHVRRDAFEQARDRWRRDPTSRNLVRPVCLRDREALRQAMEDLRRTIDACGSASPAFLSLTDEPSVTRSLNPIDWCRCDHCAGRFQRFLIERWGSEGLAREIWGARWPAGGAPSPVDTDEARRALLHGIGPMDLVTLWSDTRKFADDALGDAMSELASEARRLRPGLRMALLGASMPSAFGGFDWEDLGPRFEVFEPYDWGAARDLVAAVAPRSDVYHTMTPRNRTPVEMQHELWRYFLRGDRGVILFNATDWARAPDSRPGGAPIESIASLLRLMGSARLAPWRDAAPLRPQVAILHSMPSTRMHWLLDTRFDGASWFNRLASYEMTHSSEAINREAWAALLSDLGLSYRFITPRDLRDLARIDEGTLALVLPRAIALSDAEVAAITSFAATRLVIADCQCGLFNHRLQKRERPALDQVFGISRPSPKTVDDFVAREPDPRSGASLVAAEPGIEPKGATAAHMVGATPLILVHRPGASRTVYMNLRIGSYVHDRIARPQTAEKLRALLRPIFIASRVRPRCDVIQIDNGPRWPFAVHARRDGRDLLVAVELAATTGARPIDWAGPVAAARPRVRIEVPGTYRVTDLLTGEHLGAEAAIEAEVSASRPAIFRLAP